MNERINKQIHDYYTKNCFKFKSRINKENENALKLEFSNIY